MGEEFYNKGTNIQEGPGINIARVPQNGRTFEYISGEDPVLGGTLVKQVRCCGARGRKMGRGGYDGVDLGFWLPGFQLVSGMWISIT